MDVTDETLGEFFKPVEPDARIVIVDKTALIGGALVRFLGSKTVTTRNGAADTNIMHSFATVDTEDGRAFAMWGTGQLNQQLGKVRKDALMFLAYRGKLPASDGSGVPVHSWVVNVASRPLDQIPDSFRDSLKPRARELVAAVDAAQDEAAKRWADRVQRGDAARGDDGYMDSFEHYS